MNVNVLNPGRRRPSDLLAEAEDWFPALCPISAGAELPDADVLLATSWATAYVVRALGAAHRRAYLVQDYEPLFYPAGSEQALAAATYSMGLHGICLGRWLAAELTGKHMMATSSVDFGIDHVTYAPPLATRVGPPAVAFYARPTTPRRGFEIGVAALSLMHVKRPDVAIHLFGEPIDTRMLPFPAISHGVLGHPDLATLYGSCAAGFVLSLTNLSLIPLEMLATGLPVVMNDGPFNRHSLESDHVRYCDPLPHRLAEGLIEVIEQWPVDRRSVASAVAHLEWDTSIRGFAAVLQELVASVPPSPG